MSEDGVILPKCWENSTAPSSTSNGGSIYQVTCIALTGKYVQHGLLQTRKSDFDRLRIVSISD